MERVSAEKGLRRAEGLLGRLQLERSLGWIDALIDGRRLQRSELARALMTRGIALGLGNFEEDARLQLGQASCLDPGARPPPGRLFQEIIQALAQPPACAQPLAALRASAARAPTGTGVVLTVGIAYGPDPFNLITGGKVRLYNAQGQRIAEQGAVPEPIGDQPTLIAEFGDDGTLADPTGRIYVSASLEGPGRVPVADLGRPEPVAVEVEDNASIGSFSLPWWAWVALGVAAAGGATAAIVVAATGDGDGTDADRGIGPIDIKF